MHIWKWLRSQNAGDIALDSIICGIGILMVKRSCKSIFFRWAEYMNNSKIKVHMCEPLL